MVTEKKQRKKTRPEPTRPAAPRLKTPRASFFTDWFGWVFWLWVCLTVFAVFPGTMSSNYLPKTLWASASIALGLLLLRPRSPDRLDLTVLGALWLAYLAWALLSLSWAPSARAGLDRWIALLLPTLGYLLARRTRFWESNFFWICFCAIAGAVALIGILQYLPEKWMGGFLKAQVNWFPGTAVPRATMGQRNYASLYFTLIIPFLAWTYFRERGHRALIPLAALALALAFLVLARTRAAWLGTATGCLFLLAAGIWPALRHHSAKTRILMAGLLTAVAVAVVLKPDTRVAHALGAKKTLASTLTNFLSSTHRIPMWQEALSVPLNPLTGAGFGNFPIRATPHTWGKKVKSLNWEVHNDYLQAYVDLGIPGGVLFCLMFGHLVFLAWKRKRENSILLAAGASIVGLAVVQLFAFTSEVVSSLIWTAGVIAILNTRENAPPLISRPVPRPLVFLMNIAAVLGLAALAITVAFTMRGDQRFRNTERLIRSISNNPAYQRADYRQRAVSEIKQLAETTLPAMRFDANMRHVTFHMFAQYAMNAKDLDSAHTFARHALALHPNDRTSLFMLVRIALEKNELREAETLLRRGVDTFGYDPYDVFAPNLANLLDHAGRRAEAEVLREKTENNRVGTPQNPYPRTGRGNAPRDIIFEWSDARAAKSYELFLWKVGENKPDAPARKTTESNTARALPLEPDTLYLWQVRAVGQYGEQWSELWFFRTESS